MTSGEENNLQELELHFLKSPVFVGISYQTPLGKKYRALSVAKIGDKVKTG